MTIIYVVEASYTDYDSSYQTNIKAFTDKTRAELYALELEEKIKEYKEKEQKIYNDIAEWLKINPQPCKKNKETQEEFAIRYDKWHKKYNNEMNQGQLFFKLQELPEYKDILGMTDCDIDVYELELMEE